jgi:hypothetical protein
MPYAENSSLLVAPGKLNTLNLFGFRGPMGTPSLFFFLSLSGSTRGQTIIQLIISDQGWEWYLTAIVQMVTYPSRR